mmetsp:Transcript_11712/g.35320  ORF Transcript_11712/g.35320 Transcript_11712/m.35320 type:complete len:202 (-) Transcript_11712:702-1307(-)
MALRPGEASAMTLPSSSRTSCWRALLARPKKSAISAHAAESASSSGRNSGIGCTAPSQGTALEPSIPPPPPSATRRAMAARKKPPRCLPDVGSRRAQWRRPRWWASFGPPGKRDAGSSVRSASGTSSGEENVRPLVSKAGSGTRQVSRPRWPRGQFAGKTSSMGTSTKALLQCPPLAPALAARSAERTTASSSRGFREQVE